MAAVTKGVIMRKIIGSTIIGALLIAVLMVAFATAGCGTATTESAQGATPAPATPEAILAQAMAASETITSGTGDFNMTLSIDADKSKLPAGAEAFLTEPMTVSGTMAFNEDPQAAEATINAAFGGQNMALGVKAVDDKAWLQLMGQWYELPTDMMQQATGGTGTTMKPLDVAGVMQALTAAGIDPSKWLTGLTIAGEDSVDGTPTYHLTGTVDINQIMTDAMKMMQDKNIMGMLPSMGAGTEGATGSSLPLPDQQQLQQMQTQLASMFEDFTVDMWIAKDTYQLRKAQLHASMVPPAGEDSQGINGIDLTAALSMAPASAPITVTPPTGAKPFSELENALGGLMGLFSGALGEGITTQ
jgi:uncharacterized protein YgfB (UPF0149 family)